MNYKLITAIVTATLLGAGCSDEEVHIDPNAGGVATNSGVVAQKNLSVLLSDINPTVIDLATGIFMKTDVEVTAYIGDRNNQQLTDTHTINFASEYGLIEPSCDTDETGSCSVTWSAIARPVAGGGGSDGTATIVAYTAGEESFTDSNGNGIFDDADVGTFIDQEEPFINYGLGNGTGDVVFDLGTDVVIDTRNGNDTRGDNGVHDTADGLFNGGGCTHSTLCSTVIRSPIIWDDVRIGLNGDTIASYFVNVVTTGLVGSVVYQNNLADNLTVTADGTSTFSTPIENQQTYSVSVNTQPAGQICYLTGGASGTINGADVTANVTCATSRTVGGTLPNGLATADVTILLNGTNNLTIATGALPGAVFTFPAPLAEGQSYTATISNDPGGTCSFTGGTDVGVVPAANVTNLALTC
jgi:hypothetical protein